MSGNVRERYLDIVKITGAASIVAFHTLSNTLNAGGGYISDAGYRSANVLHHFLYLAVPMFVLATGAGFLSGVRENSYKSMKYHIIKTVSCITCFGFLFAIINALAYGEGISPGNLTLSVLTDNTWSHMWYLYRLLGVYLCMPLLSAFMNHTAQREQIIFAGTVLFFSSLYLYAAGKIGFIPATVMPISGIWFFYLIVGGILGRAPEKLQKYRYLPPVGILLGTAAVLWESAQGNWFDETHPFVLLTACSLFAEIRILCGEKRSSPWLTELAQTALGVYIIHPVFIHVCVRLLRFNPRYHLPLLTMPLTIAAVFGCSVMLVWLLRKVPFIRKYLL